MLNRRKSYPLAVSAIFVCLVMVGLGTGWAQGAGTPNLVPAAVHEGSTTGIVDVRFFEGSGNETISIGFKGEMGKKSDASIMFLDLDNVGKDPISGVVRRSDLQLLALNWKWEFSSVDKGWGISFMPGFELATGGPRGTNSSTNAWAENDSFIPTLAVPMQKNAGSWTWLVQPKAAWWDSNWSTSGGSTIEGFGSVVGIGLGATKRIGSRFTISADVTPIVSGSNTINKNTNEVDDDVVWGGALTWHCQRSSRPTNVTIFGTNAAGPTVATSLIAAPDNSTCFGVRVERAF